MKTEPNEITALSTVRSRSSLGLSEEQCWSFFEKVMDAFPQLDTPSRLTGKMEGFKLANRTPEGEELAAFLISTSGNAFTVVSRQRLEPKEWRGIVIDSFDLLFKYFTISPLSVSYIDSARVFTWKTKKNHGKVLFDIFGKTSPLNMIVNESQIFDYDLDLSLLINKDEDIICKLQSSSDVSGTIRRMPLYPEEQELEIRVGIAKTGNFRIKADLLEAVRNVQNISQKFLSTKFRKYILEPIGNQLGS